MRDSKKATCSGVGDVLNPASTAGAGTGPSPAHSSIPDKFAAPPRADTAISPFTASAGHGPSRFHVPACPLSKVSSTVRPLTSNLTRSLALSSHTWTNT